jgi:RimJ/RimL family protein N-acetyltransferase
MTIKPILFDLPEEITTERLCLRCARPGDGAEMHSAVSDSLGELREWMPWARADPTPDDYEVLARMWRVKFLAREDLPFLVFLKGTFRMIGATGLHRFDWSVPRFEIGYWIRTSYTGLGYGTEAARAMMDFAFSVFKARRLEIHFDSRNERSRRIAERLGFEQEGRLRNFGRDARGELYDKLIYAKTG